MLHLIDKCGRAINVDLRPHRRHRDHGRVKFLMLLEYQVGPLNVQPQLRLWGNSSFSSADEKGASWVVVLQRGVAKIGPRIALRPQSVPVAASLWMLRLAFWEWDLLETQDDVLEIRLRLEAKFLVVDVDGVDDVCEMRTLKSLSFTQNPTWKQDPILSTPIQFPFDLSGKISHCILDVLCDSFMGSRVAPPHVGHLMVAVHMVVLRGQLEPSEFSKPTEGLHGRCASSFHRIP
ncbi:hypothetical protein [Streptomyces sp. NPDC048191]|uniref:hypothetical protein n=1 Tax=Streptomyces sp. NPDC048191 TaxID=3155484 RepID=UPI0033D855A9